MKRKRTLNFDKPFSLKLNSEVVKLARKYNAPIARVMRDSLTKWVLDHQKFLKLKKAA